MEIKIEDLLRKIAELEHQLSKALARIEELEKENKKLKAENAMLKARLGMNSSNSSFPPSSDKFGKKKDKNRSLRKKSGKASGGQIGHKGSTLEKVDNPDFVIELPNEICPHCAANLKDVKVEEVKTRQVFDIPEIKINVTEYQAHLKTCPHCNKKSISEFPENVTHNAQYGANIKGLILNLNVYHCLPYKRLTELLIDVFNLKISEGTIYNTLKTAHTKLEKVENFFKEQLAKSEVAHADETGTKVNGFRRWIHSFSNDKLTVLTSHKNRGKKAIVEAGILPNFHGILSHDCWYAYDCFNVIHALCNAHLLRELNFLEENTELKFPTKVKDILITLKDMIDSGVEIDEKTELDSYLKYMFAVEQGYLEERIHYPLDNTQVGKGKKKRSKAFNLLKRLSRHADVLTFFLERDSSLFTNNDAEREIRNVKIKSKVQGAFRSDLGSEIYCRVRGYIATMKKNGQNQYEALKSIFDLCDIMLPVIS